MPRHGLTISERTALDGTTSYHIRYAQEGQAIRETFPTRQLAADRVAEITYWRTISKLPPDERGKRISVNDYMADKWWPSESPSWKPGTKLSYRSLLANWLEDYLGELMIAAVTVEVLDRFRARLLREGCGAPTINKLWAVCEGVWNHARQRGYVESNPWEAAKALPHKPRVPSEPIELLDVFRLWKIMSPLDGLVAMLIAILGLRQQEIFALAWRALIDKDGQAVETITVIETISGGELVTGAKSKAGERELTVPGWLRGLIGEVYRVSGSPPRGLQVFTTRKGARMTHKVYGQNRLAPAERKLDMIEQDQDGQPILATEGKFAGKPLPLYTPHDLRDVAPLIHIRAGWDLNSLMSLMGHTSITTTQAHYWSAVKAQKGKPTVSVDKQLAAALKRVGPADWQQGQRPRLRLVKTAAA